MYGNKSTLSLLVRVKTVAVAMETSMKVSLKAKTEQSHDAAVPVSEYSPKVTLMSMFVVIQFTRCLLTVKWIRKTFHLCTGTFFSCKTKS